MILRKCMGVGNLLIYPKEDIMPYGETKVYYDGSHYIAIPHTTRPARPRRKPVDEEITVVETDKENDNTATAETITETSVPEISDTPSPHTENETVADTEQEKPISTTARKMTKKQLFDKLYAENINLSKAKRRKKIVKEMRPYFKDEESTDNYVILNMERKARNLISRRIRLMRKVNLQEFNYFVTFTYDSALLTETSFRKKLRNTLSHFCSRKGWRYIGVWERSPEKKRLHFHGIFHIPDGTMPGSMENVNSYSFSSHKRQITKQNTYFLQQFGRNDFDTIETQRKVGDAVAYILKYIEKSGEKIVYSRGLPQFFISDIMDEDIVCPIGLEDKKLLLFDDFTCWDEGCYMGAVSKDTIKQMRKSN